MPDIRSSAADGARFPGMMEVHVERAAELDQTLNNAVDVISKAAHEHQIGIMITRIAVGRYIVRAHPDVPFGLTRQLYA
jgi:hypothetical protein